MSFEGTKGLHVINFMDDSKLGMYLLSWTKLLIKMDVAVSSFKV